MQNLNKLVTNLFTQVYDMGDQQNEVNKAMEVITQETTKLAHKTEETEAKAMEN